MPGTGEIVPVLELMKSSWLQRVIGNQSHWIQVDSGQLKQETVHTLTHSLKRVIGINSFPKILTKLFNGKSKYLLTYNIQQIPKELWLSAESYFKSRTSMTCHEYKKWTLWKMSWSED